MESLSQNLETYSVAQIELVWEKKDILGCLTAFTKEIRMKINLKLKSNTREKCTLRALTIKLNLNLQVVVKL
jgi:hypothetical protein